MACRIIDCRIIAAGMNDKRDAKALYAPRLRGIAILSGRLGDAIAGFSEMPDAAGSAARQF
jgi:hypothetical protein